MPASANIDQIFADALDRPAGAERSRFLEEVCGSGTGTRERVERLLRAHADSASFLETPAAPHAPRSDRPSLTPGTRIGPYRLLEQIGEGGMGVVYVAEQLEPVKRLVALKIIKPGMDTRQVIARFEAERQALSLMDHPNIAKVLDAGTVAGNRRSRDAADAADMTWDGDDGRPYFVMELVCGAPITQYCDEHRLTPRQRLELFVPVCQAIQHAHQKGIIHRDLKPSNILVGEYDARPLPKVIDFGVAKAIGHSLMDRTTFTGIGQIVGTLEYMSPEQAKLNQVDIDTRSDIYSLGVLLYELLTGTTPFDQARLRTLAFDETLRMIREEEPEQPSRRLTRLRTLERKAWSDGEAPRGAAMPHHALRGTRLRELDWIVMKCLEKDRNRRYESASGLARDVERYLQNEPVVACPPSRWYRFRKLVRRNQTAFVAIAAVLLMLVLGFATLATSNYLIRQEQARTRDEHERTEVARRLAEQRAEEVRQGLERLQAANALLNRGRWYAFETRWDDANAAFSLAIELHPRHVSVWIERADLYTRLGLWDRAAADFAREMEWSPPNTTARWFHHALLRRSVGDEKGCVEAARTMRERFAGTVKDSFVEDIVRASVLTPDAAESELPLLISLGQAAAYSRHATMPFVLGVAYFRAGQDEQAIRQLDAALASESQMPIRWVSYPILAMAHHRLGHATEARQALDEAARILDIWTQQRYVGKSGLWIIHQGADGYWPAPWWDYLECQLFYDEAKRLIDGVAPPDDARLHVLRARALSGLKYLDAATEEYDSAVKLREDDPQIRLEWRRHRGRCRVERRQWGEAAIEFAAAVELRPEDAYQWRYLAVAQFAAEDRAAYRKTCQAMLEQFGDSENDTTVGNVLLACTLQSESLSDMALLLPLAERTDSLWHWGSWVRGAALYRAGKYEQSVQSFEAAARWYRPRAWDWCFLGMAHYRLGNTDKAQQCLAEAARWIDAANQRTEADPTDTQPAWGNWHEKAAYPLLLREAEALLSEDSMTSTAAP